MRLSPKQRAAVVASCTPATRPSATLVRVTDRWAAVWTEPQQPRGCRWRGQLVASVDAAGRVWWEPEVAAGGRRPLIAALVASAKGAA